ncbi:MAG: hypothetical protein A2506_04045 [Elusimicrobia bacterium RIFOXYD12_FULL_66_9]|nr:MAG: hypothetical protein A2506_04045 [Elusimicrobia bacterium RIFOXYD12_FULL_66_9]
MASFGLALLTAALPFSSAVAAEFDSASLGRLFDGARTYAPLAVTAAPGRTRAALNQEQSETLAALFKAVPAAARAWPGYDFLDRPFLVTMTDGSAVLIGHPAPPPDFRPVAFAGRLVYVSDRGPAIGFAFKTNFDFAGAKVMAVRGGDKSTPAELVRFAVHERFHDHQHGYDFTRGYESYRVEEAEDVALAALEDQALARWLRTDDADAMRDFAALRTRRRTLFPGTAAETGEENNEGTARFVETAADVAMEGDAASKQVILRGLETLYGVEDMPKWRLYAVGAALGRFMESQTPGAWQREVQDGRRLSDMALARLAVGPAEADARVARLTAGPEYAAALAAGRKSVADLKAQRQEVLRRFEGQAGLRVVLQSNSGDSEYFSGKKWIDYPDGSMLFDPVGEYVGAGFELKDIMLRKTEASELEFFLPAGSLIEIDGAPRRPGVSGRFASVRLEARGVRVEIGPGTFSDEGKTLRIVRQR